MRRSTLTHAMQMRQLMGDAIVKIGAIAESFCELDPNSVRMQVFFYDHLKFVYVAAKCLMDCPAF